ncbi:DUF4760 domain-containing protein [Legionella pneumophila]|uniref:DUF4760 domain-containing protein n=1 Tax=Legionella pneumophila TaxID=446 RepID=UPI0013749CA5|nr:hypothetical protein [Legionella pneumophila]HAT2147266.1 hypothetical protein [Legionella pneumophila]HAT2150370.1 hypothetical protein [Legionella pneumophila]HAT8729803.1 hypothetical protein [Legionella pneumophila]HCC0305314.1 hypothetical protein [Legionella pneumophila]
MAIVSGDMLKGIMYFLLFAILLSLFFWFLPALKFFNFPEPAKPSEHTFIYYIISLAITFIIVYIAYTKSKEAIKQSRTNYLLKIDERFCSPEIIKAREIIHEYYLNIKQKNNEIEIDTLKQELGKKVIVISRDINFKSDYIYLLNFLDFLETIGYLYVRNAVTIPELNELLGNSIVYFYEIFQPYIKHRRDSKGDQKFYSQFEQLYKSVKNHQKCSVDQCCWCLFKLRLKRFIQDKLE